MMRSKNLSAVVRLMNSKRLRASTFIAASLCIVISGPLAATASARASSLQPVTPLDWPQVTADQTAPAQPVTGGVYISTETWYTVRGAEHASLLNVDLTNPHVHLGVVQANNQLLSPDETISSMANRTQAIAGINGDFYEIGSTGDAINMEVLNGQLEQSPNSYAIFGIAASGHIVMNHETFSGTITDGAKSYPLGGFNHYNIPRLGGITVVTSELGAMNVLNDTVVMLQRMNTSTSTFGVATITSTMAILNKLTAGQEALVGGGASAQWLQSSVHQGNTITMTTSISPDNHLQWALGGGPILIQNGQFYTDATPPNPWDTNIANPLTGIGVTKDGKHLMMVVFDGRSSGPSVPIGLTRPEMAGYLLAHGAYQAMLFDGGRSSEMVVRLPSQSQVSVINHPASGTEQPVANGLFVYSN